MAVQLNHAIIWTHDNKESSHFIAELLGLPAPDPVDPFYILRLSNEVTLDFMDSPRADTPLHYCFLVTEDEFTDIFARIQERNLTYYADPFHQEAGQINHNDGGRGAYFKDLDGHNVEIITKWYGSGA
jgi:catechol 2,3-dioxygenase-like lactoylglutathione lyase family enzyme